ncbi:acyl-CoA thioesterase [Pedobacter antarcticus]|uniref:acyl-CoA thioesterase n=1 Tax=Pedobacter antarcticus TaxID=34086 RepID=UPI000883AC5F|nr:thioesterase family protein [Pedobacter antarcticus]SDL37183.1 acyl-CoA thioester hydrolase [Pedobacter antarcticus]
MIFKTFWRKNKKQDDIKSETDSNLDKFKYKTTIETRFVDFDMMGHVNNAMYFTYMEIARTKYWKQAISWDWEKTGVVIASAGINYKLPVFLKDTISMYVRTSRIGNTSFDLEYVIVKHINGEEKICTRGKTTCVAFDYKTKTAVEIPAHERNKMIEFEQL